MSAAEGTLARRPGSGRKSVITDEVRRVVEEQMRRDDETTASQLHVHLTSLGYTEPSNHPSLQDVTGVDIQRKCLLPAHTRCQ